MRRYAKLTGLFLSVVWNTTGCTDGDINPPSNTQGAQLQSAPATPRALPPTEGMTLLRTRVTALLNGFADASDLITELETLNLVTEAARSCSVEPLDPTESVAEALRVLVDEMLERVLRDEFLVASTANSATFELNAAVFCEDAGCVRDLQASPVQFTLQADEETLFVAVRVGSAMEPVATFLFGPTVTSVHGDLSYLLLALQSLSATQPTQPTLPALLEGVVAFSVTQLAPGDYMASWDIAEGVRVQQDVTRESEVHILDGRMASGTEIASARVNGAMNQLGGAWGVGALDATLPGALLCTAEDNCTAADKASVFAAHAAGATGDATLTPAQRSLRATGVSLGTTSSTVTQDGRGVVNTDLNPNSGAQFAIDVTEAPEGTLITFTPELDLRAAITITNLTEVFRIDLPEWLSDQVLNVTLTGESTTSVVLPRRQCPTEASPVDSAPLLPGASDPAVIVAPETPPAPPGQLKVVTGTFDATATETLTGAAHSLNATAGSCLGDKEMIPEGSHPIDAFEVQACEF